jgi:tetratricopeptide (TPR) repeat protein
MNDNFYTDNVLDAWLHGRVEGKEAEARLREQGVDNPVAALELHQAAAKAIQQYEVLRQVQAVHRLYAPKAADANVAIPQKGKVLHLPWVKWSMRVAALLLLMAGGWIGYEYAATNTSTVYGEVFQPYYVNTDRGVGNVVTHRMVEEFKAGDYAAVINTYQKLPASSNREKFLTAYAYHQTGKQSEAIALLRQVLLHNQQSGSRLYQDEAEFYLALSQLKNGNKEEAVRLLTAIRNNPDHTFHQQVKAWTLTKLKWIQ